MRIIGTNGHILLLDVTSDEMEQILYFQTLTSMQRRDTTTCSITEEQNFSLLISNFITYFETRFPFSPPEIYHIMIVLLFSKTSIYLMNR